MAAPSPRVYHKGSSCPFIHLRRKKATCIIAHHSRVLDADATTRVLICCLEQQAAETDGATCRARSTATQGACNIWHQVVLCSSHLLTYNSISVSVLVSRFRNLLKLAKCTRWHFFNWSSCHKADLVPQIKHGIFSSRGLAFSQRCRNVAGCDTATALTSTHTHCFHLLVCCHHRYRVLLSTSIEIFHEHFAARLAKWSAPLDCAFQRQVSRTLAHGIRDASLPPCAQWCLNSTNCVSIQTSFPSRSCPTRSFFGLTCSPFLGLCVKECFTLMKAVVTTSCLPIEFPHICFLCILLVPPIQRLHVIPDATSNVPTQIMLHHHVQVSRVPLPNSAPLLHADTNGTRRNKNGRRPVLTDWQSDADQEE